MAVLELDADLEAGLLALDRVLQVLDGIFVVEADVRYAVARRHQVVVVQHLEGERVSYEYFSLIILHLSMKLCKI